MVVRAGKLRPSQIVSQFGPGALIDLPSLSMVATGIEDWNTSTARRVDEPRLAQKLGVGFFRRPPYLRRPSGGGLPSRVFPRFMVCPRCHRLAAHKAFEFRERRYPEYVCSSPDHPGWQQAVFPARFMVACRRGHLDDFPWHDYVHGSDNGCNAELRLTDTGRTGAITDLWVHCSVHAEASRNLGQAMGTNARSRLPRCSGLRPWLGVADREPCDEQIHVILRGASNAYFPVVESSISVPPWSDPIQLIVGEYIDELAKVVSLDDLDGFFKFVNAPALEQFPRERVWSAIERRRSGQMGSEDLRREEWLSFTRDSGHTGPGAEFQIRPVAVPTELKTFVSGVTQVVRLREVRALRGFTRIDPIPDVGDLGEVDAVNAGLAPLANTRLSWLPGIDQRGEGVFLRLDEAIVREWEDSASVQELHGRHATAQKEWYEARDVQPPRARPARYLLLHSLAHVLIRQLGLECGYASSSLRERIYYDAGADPMAGILIYTASADSEGSLGGLVEMSRPEIIGPMMQRALEASKLCANDPLCADRAASATGTQLNGAACHACLLESETSCEVGNNYLDRGVLAGTLRSTGTAFVSDG